MDLMNPSRQISLPEGIYEEVISSALEKGLMKLSLVEYEIEKALIVRVSSSQILSRYVSKVLEKSLR
jgi:hypothetical protein